MYKKNHDAMITYIKKGKEATKVITRWNDKRILKEIVEMSDYRFYEPTASHYTIKDDIEFVYFKNINFVDVFLIESPKDAICIFEECMFGSRNIGYESIKLSGGSFQIINPTLINMNEFSASYANIQDLSICAMGNGVEKLNIGRCSLNRCKILEVKDDNHIKKIDAFSEQLILTGNFSLISGDLAAENLRIEGKSLDDKTIVVASRLWVYANKDLGLVNCMIDGSNNLDLFLLASNIQLSNVTLKASERIVVNDYIYQKKADDFLVVVDDKKLAQTNLISLLKGYKGLLESQIEIKKEELLENSYFNLFWV